MSLRNQAGENVMSFHNHKIYPLPTGEFIVSYLDTAKRKRIQKKFSNETEARDFYQNFRSSAEKKLSRIESNVGHLLRSYLKEQPNCYLIQSGILVREFLSVFEVYSPHDLTETVLRSFLTQLKNENDYSDRSMLVAKSRLQGFFRYLIETEILHSSPIDNIKFDRGAPFRRKPIILSKAEIKDYIQKAKKFSPALFYPIFILISETAAKSADILKLQWKDLNQKTRAINLDRSSELQARNFILSDELLAAIKRVQPVGDFVFTNLEGKQLQKHILSRELKRFQRRVQISTNWGLKDLRSSFAAHHLKEGGSIKGLQKLMGHKSFHNTEEIYGHYQAISIEVDQPAIS
jgi:integrase